MADLHIKAGSSGTSPFDTWAKAATTMAGATGGVAGDRYLVSSAHTESNGSSTSINYASSATEPVQVLSVSEAAGSGAVALQKGAQVLMSASSANLAIATAGYFYGIVFTAGTSGAATSTISLGNSSSLSQRVWFDSCDFVLAGGGSQRVYVNSSTYNKVSHVVWRGCNVKMVNASQRIGVYGTMEWRGGSLMAGSACTVLMEVGLSSRHGVVNVIGVDLSAGPSNMALVGNALGTGLVRFIGCQLPPNWTGNLVNAFDLVGMRVEMINCDSGDTNYRMWIEEKVGSIKTETALVRAGGASDGDTPISWKMASSGNTHIHSPLFSNDMVLRNTTTGSAITLTVEILHDSVTALKDNEVWLEVDYLGTSGYPLVSNTSNRSDVLSAGNAHASSSATWTTTGMSNPNKQKLSVTITPQEVGPITARVAMVKPSYTVYVDPKITVS